MDKSQKQTAKFYWDASVFIHLIQGTESRIDRLISILNDCESGKSEVFTSVLSISEVPILAEEISGILFDSKTLEKINCLWHPKSVIKTVDIYPEILMESTALIRKCMAAGLPGLTPMDAIHIATAKNIAASEYHCFERREKLSKYGQCAGVKIVEPQLLQAFLFENADNGDAL